MKKVYVLWTDESDCKESFTFAGVFSSLEKVKDYIVNNLYMIDIDTVLLKNDIATAELIASLELGDKIEMLRKWVREHFDWDDRMGEGGVSFTDSKHYRYVKKEGDDETFLKSYSVYEVPMDIENSEEFELYQMFFSYSHGNKWVIREKYCHVFKEEIERELGEESV